ncbi:bifunctional helix-turn-helix transcriptional regulator/GNAT family N-acetyltransferase [Asticcacaulis sp. EMRT-3]|uniref:bifunctional helix-turn-helix transcriptional regulator/GNAT family N-acetyltransferase n=1 Tax=Asticcacaulis sp. EMRT-3 TaxID=3040349 RepID=UPI0024AECB26|nr:bifunctional helix-turn-helix transcriptional regulator/GNAT family N-acetyltransferase [Asticcacaulis sp. EMRT-3]MDI7774192.1 bifunctional helix-turn-helix transcriptional regulator/GNAT family N-acetyltransferase [Asticcacaulis sp. EMRT-3]
MDIVSEMGAVFLGSRLKRLAERLQADAARIVNEAGLPVQPAHMPVLMALDRQPLTIGQLVEVVGVSQPGMTRGIGQLVELGLVQSEKGEDQRIRTIHLTSDGQAAMARAKHMAVPRIEAAVQSLFATLDHDFLAQIARVEAALDERSLYARAGEAALPGLKIREYTPDLAQDFHEINAEWISGMFRLEATDIEVLRHPDEKIIKPGGTILFVEAAGLGIVGTCALQKTGPGAFELTKMGVRSVARGMKAGEFLLAAMIERAQAMQAETLYLLTNSKCAAAIHLYEKLGFRHDAAIMATYGARYARCDVAMRFGQDGVFHQVAS